MLQRELGITRSTVDVLEKARVLIRFVLPCSIYIDFDATIEASRPRKSM